MSSKNLENASERLQTTESYAHTVSHENQMETVSQPADGGASKAVRKRKMNKRSGVWAFYKEVQVLIPGSLDTFEVNAQCIYCSTKLSCDSKLNGTSVLQNHTKVCRENPRNSQKTLLTYIPPEGKHGDGVVGTLKNFKFNQEAVRKALAHMIMVDELPFRFVERAGFQHFMRITCPMFSIPSRWTVVRDCYLLYEEEKVKLKAFLKKSTQRVCVTTDTWTSVQRINYLCLTAHFVDSDWNLNKRILNFFPISSHRGEDIGIVIEQCLADWGISNVFIITVDNAASNSTAIAYLRKKLTLCNGCVLGVSYVRQSPSRWEKFKECITIEKITSKSHVCLDVRTRWNSTYLMLESALKFEGAFERVELQDLNFSIELNSKRKGKGFLDVNADVLDADCDEIFSFDDDTVGVPNKTDWDSARIFVSFLSHFYTLTVRISGSKYVTSNTFLTEISEVLYLLEEWQRGKDKAVVEMATKMKQKYDKYWGSTSKMNMLIYVAVVLDPRHKLDYVQWTLLEIYSGDKQVEAMQLVEMVKVALHELFKEYMQKNNYVAEGRREETATSKLQGDMDGVNSSGEGNSKLVSLYMMHKSRAHNEENGTELDTYLREETENICGDFDILAWWKMHSPRFPILSQMARNILAVSISTVASESPFSSSGQILDPFRSSLTPRIVQALICTQDWIRSSISHSHICVEEDVAEIEKFDEDLRKISQENHAME